MTTYQKAVDGNGDGVVYTVDSNPQVVAYTKDAASANLVRDALNAYEEPE